MRGRVGFEHNCQLPAFAVIFSDDVRRDQAGPSQSDSKLLGLATGPLRGVVDYLPLLRCAVVGVSVLVVGDVV